MRSALEPAAISGLLEAFRAREDLRGHMRNAVRALLEEHCVGTQHVLGFAHIRLGELDGWGVRLHMWPNPPWRLAEPAWPIHTHGWTVESFVAIGGLENSRYKVLPDPLGENRLYEVVYGPDFSERVATDSVVTVEPDGSHLVDGLAYYDIPVGAFHSSRVVSDFAATLVVTSPKGKQPALVVGERDSAARFRYVPQAAEPALFRDLLERTLEGLPG